MIKSVMVLKILCKTRKTKYKIQPTGVNTNDSKIEKIMRAILKTIMKTIENKGTDLIKQPALLYPI